ncbi:hypothetical protein HMI54_000653 [Coelomomyces lativittatus]|nr:hypothetical protein HMI54_000653 [Coelomomyces lativittatus]
MSLKDKNEMYCFKRKLTPKLAGTILLTGFSIGIGISGEFFGWNTGLENGWYNMLIAIFISAVMYMGLILSICELCCALPFSSGTGYFAQKSFTVALGALTSATFASHYCLLGASILIALANSISAASLATSYLFLFIICLLTFIVESYPKFFFQLTFCLAAYGFLILLSYVIFTCYVSLTSGVPIEMKNAPSIKMEQMHTYGHTINLKYILKCYPYASWFFIGLEVPLFCI